MITKRRVGILILCLVIISLIVTIVRLDQVNTTLDNKEAVMDNYFRQVLEFDTVQAGFELAREHQDKPSYTNLYNILSDMEHTIRVLTTFYWYEIESVMGNDVFYIDGGSISGAAPIALLNAKDGEISKVKLNELEELWSTFFLHSRHHLMQDKEVPTDIAIEYKRLAIDVMKWAEDLK